MKNILYALMLLLCFSNHLYSQEYIDGIKIKMEINDTIISYIDTLEKNKKDKNLLIDIDSEEYKINSFSIGIFGVSIDEVIKNNDYSFCDNIANYPEQFVINCVENVEIANFEIDGSLMDNEHTTTHYYGIFAPFDNWFSLYKNYIKIKFDKTEEISFSIAIPVVFRDFMDYEIINEKSIIFDFIIKLNKNGISNPNYSITLNKIIFI